MTHIEHALTYVQDGMVVGLGTGRAASSFIEGLGQKVQAGLKVVGVATSEKSAQLAAGLGIQLATLAEVDAKLDLCVDGTDEFDPELNLIKGLGGALVREKVVAASAKKLVILVGPDNVAIKRAKRSLGERGVLPVEVIPFALALCQRRLTELDCVPELRMADGKPFVSDNGNAILDCRIGPLTDPATLETEILAIPGVLGTGLFLGMADVVLVQDGDRLDVLEA